MAREAEALPPGGGCHVHGGGVGQGRHFETTFPGAVVVEVDRVAVVDRSATARLLDTSSPTSPATVWLATGGGWPDALAAGAAAAATGDRLLLVGEDVQVTTGLRFDGSLATASAVHVAGGPLAVPEVVLESLCAGIRSAVPELARS